MYLLGRGLIAALFVILCAAATVSAQERNPALPPPPPPPLTTPGERVLPARAREVRDQIETQKPQDEFRPISELPPEERLPAAPMLVAAYVFVVLALFAYVLSVSRRLGSVTNEIARLEGELKRGGRT